MDNKHPQLALPRTRQPFLVVLPFMAYAEQTLMDDQKPLVLFVEAGVYCMFAQATRLL